jgi:hypothetical protein
MKAWPAFWISALFILSGSALGADDSPPASESSLNSADLYYQGNIPAAWLALNHEVATRRFSPMLLEQRLKMARQLVSQDPTIALKDYRSLLQTAAETQASGPRIRPALSALTEAAQALDSLDSMSLQELSRALESSISHPSLNPDFSRAARLQMVSLVLGRKWRSRPDDPELLFLLGKAKHFETSSGELYLERFSALPRAVTSAHREEAAELLKSEHDQERFAQ